jgi:hypothetical protein
VICTKEEVLDAIIKIGDLHTNVIVRNSNKLKASFGCFIRSWDFNMKYDWLENKLANTPAYKAREKLYDYFRILRKTDSNFVDTCCMDEECENLVVGYLKGNPILIDISY